MPAPPGQVQIKRKRDEDPVEFLHVHNQFNGISDRHVFMRKKPRITAPDTSTPSAISFTGIRNLNAPPIPISLPGAVPQALGNGLPVAPTQSQAQTLAAPAAQSAGPQEPRRFYFSRTTQSKTQDGISHGKAPPKVFIEKRVKRVVNKPSQGSLAPKEDNVTTTANASLNPPALPATAAVHRSQPPLRNMRLPSGKMVPWDATATKLASEMQAYTLEQITQNMAQTPTHVSPPVRKSSTKFKPTNPPPLRYNERHPEANSAATGAEDQEMEFDDDSAYVLETYVRMPIEMVESLGPTKNYGLLVLDSQPDIDEFYNDDSDDDSEIFDEEEDENAENHHSTDYPEDEVDSDDEFGRNPYNYRNRNASDEEEFDEDDEGGTFSDDEESWKPAWARKN